MVKRILNRYGYPPDLQEEAVKTVLLQPHWRHNTTAEPTEPVLIPPRNLPAKS